MSLFTYGTGLETPINVRLTDMSYHDVAEGGNNGCTVVALAITELAGGTPTVILEIFDGTDVLAQRANERPFTAHEMWEVVKLDSVPIVLLPNQTLRAKASAGNVLDCNGVFIDPSEGK